jgi:hypothetical protein
MVTWRSSSVVNFVVGSRQFHALLVKSTNYKNYLYASIKLSSPRAVDWTLKFALVLNMMGVVNHAAFSFQQDDCHLVNWWSTLEEDKDKVLIPVYMDIMDKKNLAD